MGCCLGKGTTAPTTTTLLSGSAAAPPAEFDIRGTYYGCVTDVYDGDTFTASINMADVIGIEGQSKPFRVRFRAWGYDSPELKPPLSTPNREHVVQTAIAARDFVRGLLLHRTFPLECLGKDKFGRILAKVQIDEERYLHEVVVAFGHGVEYYGGTRGVAVTTSITV